MEDGINYFFPSATGQTIEAGLEPAACGMTESSDQTSLVLSWLGSRYSLTRNEAFSTQELKWLKGIGAFLDSRHRMIADPDRTEKRLELFRGPPEDRYVSASIWNISAKRRLLPAAQPGICGCSHITTRRERSLPVHKLFMALFELISFPGDSAGESMAVFKCSDSLAVRGMSGLLNLPCEECKFRCPRHVRALARTDALCCSVRGRASIQNRNKSSKASVENPCRPRGVLLARRSRRSWCLCLIRVLTIDASAPVREPKMAANAEIC